MQLEHLQHRLRIRDFAGIAVKGVGVGVGINFPDPKQHIPEENYVVITHDG
jgi:hypothetical protein